MQWNQIGILSKSFPAGKDFCPNSGDEKKRNHEIFGVFQNLEKIFSQNIFSRKKKIFEMKYILRISSQILENPKNFMISFFHPLSFNGVVLGENLSSLLSKGLSGKSVLITFICYEITPSKTFPAICSQTSPNPIPDQSQSHQSLPLKTKIQFDQNFLPAKQSANYSMFFRRL